MMGREASLSRTQSAAAGDVQLIARAGHLDGLILTMAVTTLAGAAVKLRRLADPHMGLEAGEGEHDLGAIRQVLTVVERDLEDRHIAVAAKRNSGP
jgi:hypothetical protein